MNDLIFKFSRLISFVSFLCIAISLYLLFFVKKNYSEHDLIWVLILILICISPLLIFNWVYFKKISLWIEIPKDKSVK